MDKLNKVLARVVVSEQAVKTQQQANASYKDHERYSQVDYAESYWNNRKPRRQLPALTL